MGSIAKTANIFAGREALALFVGLGNVASRRLRVCTQCRYNSTGRSVYPLR